MQGREWGCTVEHRRAATSNRNGTFAPAAPAPEGSGEQPRARQAAELAGEGQCGPQRRGHIKDRMQAQQEHRAPVDPAEPKLQRETEVPKSTASTCLSQGGASKPLWQIKRTKNALLQPGS